MPIDLIQFSSLSKCRWNAEPGGSKAKPIGLMCICYLVKAVSWNQTDGCRGQLPAATEILLLRLPAENPHPQLLFLGATLCFNASHSQNSEKMQKRKVILLYHSYHIYIYIYIYNLNNLGLCYLTNECVFGLFVCYCCQRGAEQTVQ